MKIVKAAIKHKGKNYTGLRHAQIMYEMRTDGVDGLIKYTQQGFLTDTGKFVDRATAAKIAFEAGQIRGPISSLDSYQVFPSKK